MAGVLKGTDLKTDTGEAPRVTDAETGMICLQAEGCQRLLASHQKGAKRPGTDSPSQPSERIHPVNCDFNVQPPEPRDGKSLLFKSPSV